MEPFEPLCHGGHRIGGGLCPLNIASDRRSDAVNRWKKKALVGIRAVAMFLLLAPGVAFSSLVPLPVSQYPSFHDDLQLQELTTILDKSLAFLRTVPASTCYTLAGVSLPVQRLIDSALYFQQLLRSSPTPEQLNQQIQRAYTVYRIDGSQSAKARRMLITGYYQPTFVGSLTRHPPFLYPLYGVPTSLRVQELGNGKKSIGRLQGGRILPFWTRKEIERHHLLHGQELVWLKDPFDAFILHVQGSGVIRLPDGTVRGVHYAQSNGRPYTSVGKYLVDSGRMQLAEVTMDSIRQYLVAHPKERDLILHQNDSFIFFHWSEAGPVIGNLGQALTAGRSLAADQQWYPPGALAFVHSRRPVMANGQVVEWKPLRRFASIQDTGSALTGPNRIDVFWGSGEQAGMEAGQMKEDGEVYLLLLNEEVR
jgi:membrane-bound lytic murein transglycosylase A